MEASLADIILLKGVSHTAMPLLAPREPAVSFDPMTGDAKLWIGTTVGNEMVSGVPGPAGISAASIAGIVSTAPGFGLPLAKGDGVTDDQPALQAQYDYCQAHVLPLLLPPGTYLLKLPLRVSYQDLGNTNQSGFVLRGLATHGQADGSGVCLKAGAPNMEALILIGVQATLHNEISNLTLDCGPASLGTGAGIKSRATHWSGLLLQNLWIAGVPQYGIDIESMDGGANGESLQGYNLFIYGTVAAIKNGSGAGQSTPWSLHGVSLSCGWNGCVLDAGSGSANISIFGLSTTAEMPPAGQTPSSTLVISRGANQVLIAGGRIEKIAHMVNLPGGDAGLNGHIRIQNLTFDGTLAGAIVQCGYTNSQNSVVFEDVIFGSVASVPLQFDNGISGSLDRIIFNACDFDNYSDVSAVTTSPRTTLRDCRNTPVNSPFFVPTVHA